MSKMTDQEITNYLFLEDEDQSGDIAFVFGLQDWKDPIAKALELYFAGKVEKLVLTGGNNRVSGEPEAENMYQFALEKGAKPEDLLVENQANNTLENVIFSKALVEKELGWENIQTVCGVMVNVAARRCLMTMKKHLPGHVTLKACPYIYRRYGIGKNDWHKYPQAREFVGRQLQKIKDYLAKGDIAEL